MGEARAHRMEEKSLWCHSSETFWKSTFQDARNSCSQRYLAIKPPEAESHSVLLDPMHYRSCAFCKTCCYGSHHTVEIQTWGNCVHGRSLPDTHESLSSSLFLHCSLRTKLNIHFVCQLAKEKYLKGPTSFSKSRAKREYRTMRQFDNEHSPPL